MTPIKTEHMETPATRGAISQIGLDRVSALFDKLSLMLLVTRQRVGSTTSHCVYSDEEDSSDEFKKLRLTGAKKEIMEDGRIKACDFCAKSCGRNHPCQHTCWLWKSTNKSDVKSCGRE